MEEGEEDRASRITKGNARTQRGPTPRKQKMIKKENECCGIAQVLIDS
jgi:hypothetical protein